MAYIIDDKIIENDKEQINAFHDRGFGDIQGDVLLLAPTEALYLAEIEKIDIMKAGSSSLGVKKSVAKTKSSSKKYYDFTSLFSELKKLDKEIAVKYYVYRDLRKAGYVVRTGLKYGTYFRVYEKGIRVGEGHSHWLVQPIAEHQKTSIYEIARAIRLAHSVRKKIIWAVVDTEGDVTYYKMERIIP